MSIFLCKFIFSHFLEKRQTATTYSIINKHHGHITVESLLGVGTTFHIYLPASDKAVPEKDARFVDVGGWNIQYS